MDDPTERLLFQWLDLQSTGRPEAAEQLLTDHPELAGGVRMRIRILESMGMLDAEEAAKKEHRAPVIPGYRLLRRIGEGGMGVVWEAKDESLERRVAIKLIRPGFVESDTAKKRLTLEARAIAQLDDPHIITVHATGEHEGISWIAMELLDGENLESLLRKHATSGRAIRTQRILSWGRDIARALTRAHARGILHRDIKPSNIQISRDGTAKLLDFGLARFAGEARITMTRSFQGTAHYAAPEQIEMDAEVGPAADVYALGATLYECFTGSVPFPCKSAKQLFHAILSKEPPRPSKLNAQISADLEAVLMQAMQKDPRARYASASLFAQDLEALLDFRPVLARPLGPARRVSNWIARHKAYSTLGALTTLGLLALPIGLWIRSATEHRRLLDQAGQKITLARKKLKDLQVLHKEVASAVAALKEGREQINRFRSGTPAAWDRFWRQRDTHTGIVADARIRRRELEQEARDLLEQSKRLGYRGPEGRTILAELLMESWRMMRAIESTRHPDSLDWLEGDQESRYFAAKVSELDSEGRFSKELRPKKTYAFHTEPSGASIYLFEFRLHSAVVDGGDERLVPTPYGVPLRDLPVLPGSQGLRVVRSHGALQENDLILDLQGHPAIGSAFARRIPRQGMKRNSAGILRVVSIDGSPVRDAFQVRQLLQSPHGSAAREHEFILSDGGERIMRKATSLRELGLALSTPTAVAKQGGVIAKVFTKGKILEMTLPSGLELRPTATPLLIVEACKVGTTPLDVADLPKKPYLAVARLSGYADARRVLPARSFVWKLVRDEDRLPGFVQIESRVPGNANDSRSDWMMEREVSSGEYLAFLNATTAKLPTGTRVASLRVPRSTKDSRSVALWPRTDSGSFRLPDAWPSDRPVSYVSFLDAKAYANWLTKERGRSVWQYRLPSNSNWFDLLGRPARTYPWGERFRPTWTKSCFSRVRACIERSMSFPIDECPLGVYDCSGSLIEMLDTEMARGIQMCVGGSWEYADPKRLRPDFISGQAVDKCSRGVGFRLVATRRR